MNVASKVPSIHNSYFVKILDLSIHPTPEEAVVPPLVQPVVTTGWYDRYAPTEAPTTLSTAVIGKKIWRNEKTKNKMERRRRRARKRKKMLELQRKKGKEPPSIPQQLFQRFPKIKASTSKKEDQRNVPSKSGLELRVTGRKMLREREERERAGLEEMQEKSKMEETRVVEEDEIFDKKVKFNISHIE